MKQIYSILIASFLCFSNGCNVVCQTKEPNLVLKSYLKGSYNLSSCDSNIYFLAEIKLFNNSDTVYEFMTYNCLTGVNIVLNSNLVLIKNNHCVSNYPTIVSLKPNQMFSIHVILQTKNNSKAITAPIRIGYILLKPRNIANESLVDIIDKMKKTNQNILWSTPFVLNIGSSESYEVN